MSNLSEFRSFKNTSKKEILNMYGNVDSRVFEAWIEPIKTEIGWRKGRQTFPPRVVERITQHLGIPFEIRLPK